MKKRREDSVGSARSKSCFNPKYEDSRDKHQALSGERYQVTAELR